MIDRADPATRRKTLIAVLALAAVGSLLIMLLERVEPEVLLAQRQLVLVVAVLLTLPMILPLALFWRLAQRVERARRFPPRNERLVRDTPVREGAAALRYARFIKLVVLLLALAVAAVPVLFFLVLNALAGA